MRSLKDNTVPNLSLGQKIRRLSRFRLFGISSGEGESDESVIRHLLGRTKTHSTLPKPTPTSGTKESEKKYETGSVRTYRYLDAA